jgi:hypothetical protein
MRLSVKIAAVVGGIGGALAFAAGNASAAEPCAVGTDYSITSVAPYRRPVETGGFGGTVSPVLRGAEVRVAARPGLTQEWLQRRLESQIAAGECRFGDKPVSVDVTSEGDSFVVRVTTANEGPGTVRASATAADERTANAILAQARELTR